MSTREKPAYHQTRSMERLWAFVRARSRLLGAGNNLDYTTAFLGQFDSTPENWDGCKSMQTRRIALARAMRALRAAHRTPWAEMEADI